MSLYTTMMDSEGTLQRPTIGRDAASGVTQAPFTTVYGPSPCSCQFGQAQQGESYDQRQAVVSAKVFFTQDPGAQINDRLLVKAIRTGQQFTLLVTGESQPILQGRYLVWHVPATYIREPT